MAVRRVRAVIAALSGAKVWPGLLAMCVFLTSASLFAPLTQFGIHCPTAPVQRVQSAGGTLRKPVAGEKDFLQCHCTEKEFAKQKNEFSKASDTLVCIVPPPIPVVVGQRLAEPPLFVAYKVRDFLEVDDGPTSPPPQTA
ncbi:MAG: hypothetical protein KIT11_02195 [Fimbriimonadaceae bacterium]|nr:hypothetical protein [Fimbriimonadaceae bacterium]QYK54820.1 MAG: hypothetical protein KF733_07340 [Fimbriimonadaceae bacterium]